MVAEPVRSALIFLARKLPSPFLFSPPRARDGGECPRADHSSRRRYATRRTIDGDAHSEASVDSHGHNPTGEEAERAYHSAAQ